uniref:Uncharacterized protein n=1 Tax=Pyrodinium bahamense TaxID=73915 RepID=A0A7S0FRQ0_9DINO|mmetsp:Transcript_43829/g.121780  ORF Transcript_43829/g.121780 Transcript_43829/m.121780 type:complete len:150 (+) Transcript_43829:57-506(+)|eukprot:CAMPEP_0179092804 /NCGR_PEP_ID=MMETSP0796-20121207/42463_1 /TAXON_ID=73915 /ORGANISM="Pyrodinium bahamense, Strain pbaha01" /LENGTH=149 /DNA_ID=CAMNT_0020790415 /DNA_START=57 /DNA_END=506 /DNA_ORIENTATION=-
MWRVALRRYPGAECPQAFRRCCRVAESREAAAAAKAQGDAVPRQRQLPACDCRVPGTRPPLPSLLERNAEEQHLRKAASARLMQADARVLLVCGALLCLGGSITAVYVAVTHDPNRKEDRPALRRGEYIAGASVVGACALVIITLRGGK